MQKLEQSWRWYGSHDAVSLQDIRQAGATHVVTALHHVPHGAIWPLDEIIERKNIIENAGLRWTVVESVPVHEAIKTRSHGAEKYIDNYKESLRNLAQCGIKVITYNFMPVLDWTRTQLDLEMPNGAKALYFNWTDLAIFDLFILKREGGYADYPDSIVSKAKEKYETMSEEQLNELSNVILMGVPSEEEVTLSDLTNSIAIYKNIGRQGLLDNLLWFLREIQSTCEEHGVVMAIHPDDPPYQILGLPRIATGKDDLLNIINGVNHHYNGICFCSGSLGGHVNNDVPAIAEVVKERVHFAHFRNVKKDEDGNFFEADHLGGDVDMAKLISIFAEENQKREDPIPFRPDHGHQMLDDLNKKSFPGYSAIGRLKGLAEIRGLELGILSQLTKI